MQQILNQSLNMYYIIFFNILKHARNNCCEHKEKPPDTDASGGVIMILEFILRCSLQPYLHVL